ncbi:polysaccharide deacetylase family protein [Pseudonocardia sp.]|uniref:polysaccharide deacetylase family protein n=1 Tax=Pseudonocardia sp. TaxID=60912 RepID=UPI002F400AC1
MAATGGDGFRMSWRIPRVLLYHNFGPAPAGGDPSGLFVEVATFRAQLALLRGRGWRALSLGEFLATLDGAPAPRRSFLVTIDDGHESVPRDASAVLAEAGVPSVLFVPPSALGGPITWNPAYAQERLCDRTEIAALAGTGMEIGVHGWDHTRMLGMDADQLDLHARRALDEVHALVGYRPRCFAFPYGSHDAPARAALADAGYAVGFAVGREHGRYAVDRISVRGSDSPAMLLLKLSLAYRLAARFAGRTPWLRHRHKLRAVPRLLREAPRAGG